MQTIHGKSSSHVLTFTKEISESKHTRGKPIIQNPTTLHGLVSKIVASTYNLRQGYVVPRRIYDDLAAASTSLHSVSSLMV